MRLIVLTGVALAACNSGDDRAASRMAELEAQLVTARAEVEALRATHQTVRTCPECQPCPVCAAGTPASDAGPSDASIVDAAAPQAEEVVEAQISDLIVSRESYLGKLVRFRGVLCLCQQGLGQLCYVGRTRSDCIPGGPGNIAVFRTEATPDDAWAALFTKRVQIMSEPWVNIEGRVSGPDSILPGVELSAASFRQRRR